MSELRHLSAADVHVAMKALGRLHRHMDADGFPQAVVEAVGPLVGHEALHYNEFENKRMLQAVAEQPDPVPPQLLGVFATLSHQHPGFAYVERTRDGSAHTISDFLARSKWHRLPLYAEFYRKLGHEDQIYFTLEMTGDAGRIVSLAMNRRRADFNARDRAVLNLLRPYVRQAYYNAQAVSDLRQDAAQSRGALEAIDRGVVALTQDGRVRWATPRAAALLAGSQPGRRRRACELPGEVRNWLERHLARTRDPAPPRAPLTLPGPTGSLLLRLIDAPTGTDWLLLIDEPCEMPASIPLVAPRLRKVLKLLLMGESEKRVAAKLRLSAHTVHQYTKEIYQQLGVNSRPELLARCLGQRRV